MDKTVLNWFVAFSVAAYALSAVFLWAASVSTYGVLFVVLGAAAIAVGGWLSYAGGRRDSKADSERLSQQLQRAFTKIDEVRRSSTDAATNQQLADTEHELLQSAFRWAADLHATREMKALARKQRLRADEQKAIKSLQPARDLFQSAVNILQDCLEAYNAGSKRSIRFNLKPFPLNISAENWNGSIEFAADAKWDLSIFVDPSGYATLGAYINGSSLKKFRITVAFSDKQWYTSTEGGYFAPSDELSSGRHPLVNYEQPLREVLERLLEVQIMIAEGATAS